MKCMVHPDHKERGVTLVELLTVVVLLTMVFGAIILWINSTWQTYDTVSSSATNQQQATLIMGQLSKQIHQAVNDGNGNYETYDSSTGTYTITTGTNPVTKVTYQNNNSQVIYTTASNQSMVLTADGNVSIQTAVSNTYTLYTITVTVGTGSNQIVQNTTVTRYDGGP